MRKLQRWREINHRYEPHLVPDEWNVKTYSDDMDERVNCARCGKKIKFGDSYTSRQIHNGFGFGYAVCPECYEEEWKEYREAKELKDE